MDSLCNILGIDRVDMNGRLILLEELHGSNGNFLINSVISNALRKQQGICLVLFHDTFGHYHNVGMRNGYNLFSLKEAGQVTVVEFMETLASTLDGMNEEFQLKDFAASQPKEKHTNHLMYKLFCSIKEKYNLVSKSNDSVTIIIDDLNHLFDLGLDIKDVACFVRYLRSLAVVGEGKLELCVVSHLYDIKYQNCLALMSNGLKYMADLIVTTEPFKSGYSSDASGRMIVRWKSDSVRNEYHWPESSIYLYKLTDWQAKIYAPGAAAT